MVPRASYDVGYYVRIIRGVHRGKIGLYEYEFTDDIAEVYLTAPPITEPVRIPRSHLVLATEAEAAWFEEVHQNDVAMARAKKEVKAPA